MFEIRKFIRKAAAVVVCTGNTSGIIFYGANVKCLLDCVIENQSAIKLYNISCKYMEKHNRHIKHELDLYDFYPYKTFVV